MKKHVEAGQGQGVTIIICAKNEADNLRRNLPSVLEQQYAGSFEVIVVNDASNDDTGMVLRELKSKYPHLKEVIISSYEKRTMKGKKYALIKGANAALHDHLLLTDADCRPASPHWLEKMVAPLAEGKQIVAGYGGYDKQAGLLNAFTRWETMHTFLQYSTYALAGMPYMAVGRNMACTREVLLSAAQHPAWNELPSGDDDLLVSACGNRHNVAIVTDPAAFTYTAAKETWQEWAGQKQRHLSTGKYYKPLAKALLALYGAAHAALWLCFFVLLFTGYPVPALELMSVRCLVYWALWAYTSTRLNERTLWPLFLLADVGWMIYNFAFFPFIAWSNKQRWT